MNESGPVDRSLKFARVTRSRLLLYERKYTAAEINVFNRIIGEVRGVNAYECFSCVFVIVALCIDVSVVSLCVCVLTCICLLLQCYIVIM